MYIAKLYRHDNDNDLLYATLGKYHRRDSAEHDVLRWLDMDDFISDTFYIILSIGDIIILDSREGNMFRKASDKEWAYLFGMTTEQFLGIEELEPPNISHLPCGQDDYVMDCFDEQRRIVQLRKEWGEDQDRCPDFVDYVRKYI